MRDAPLRRIVISTHVLSLLLLIIGLAMPGVASAVSSRTLFDVAGISPGDELGSGGSSIGDLDGDGYDDVVVGAEGVSGGTGAAYILFGGPNMSAAGVVILNGEAAFDRFGSSTASVGDFNGDGHIDFVVGAYNADVSVGRVYMYYGGPGFSGTPDLIFAGQGINSFYGESVGGLGDINSDGYDDLIVGARLYDAGGMVDAGRAYVYLGGSAPDTTADLTLDGEAADDEFGSSVDGAGDVNGDGLDDIIVGARFYSGISGDAGRAYIFFGAEALNGDDDVVLDGGTGDWFGYSVAGAGDVNGDGYDDVIVGAIQANVATGAAYVYYGAAAMDQAADLTFPGIAGTDFMGYSVDGGFDANGDGYSDVIVGRPREDDVDTDAGAAFVFFGGASPDEVADLVYSGEGLDDQFGSRVRAAGDLDGDGHDDVMVLAPLRFGTDAGKAYFYSIYPYQIISPNGGEQLVVGKPATLRWRGHDPADLSMSHDGGASWALIAAGIGGNDENEYAFGVPGPATQNALVRLSYAGQATTHSSSDISDGVFSIVEPFDPPAAVHPLWLTMTGGAGDLLGYAVSGIGDFSGDGADDYVVTALGADEAWIFHGGAGADNVADLTLNGEVLGDQFGWAASGGGDFNGDGYSDILVSARSNDAVAANAGRAYVYYGGPGADAVADVTFSGEEASDFFGRSVSMTGDLNGDGYADAIVGAANGGASSEGRAYVFLGGAVPDNVADLTITGPESLQNFTLGLATLGDVNGDGFDDFAIGESGNDAMGDNAGRVYVYFGGTTLDGTADWVVSGEGALDGLGVEVSAAGDVNGDGYDDLLTTAPGNDAGGANAGRAYVFHGGPAPDTYPDWLIDGQGPNTSLGTSCAGAGDLNGDGFHDVVVGVQGYNSNTGRVYVYYGGPGADDVADAYMDGEVSSDIFSDALAIAGDIDQDGFADILVGARLNDAGGGNSGRAYLFDSQRYVLSDPNGGETWNVGGTETVRWTGTERADILLSVDGGATFTPLKEDVGGQAMNDVPLQVPHLPTKFAIIKVAPADPGVGGDDRSDDLFTIETSVSLLTFTVAAREGGGAELDWSTDPVVSPEGIAGYRLYRVDPGAAGLGRRIGPNLITATRYVDASGTPGSVYRLAAVNGLGQELELGREMLALAQPLAAWPLPYRGGVLNISFAVSSALGGGLGKTELSIYDAAGRRVRTIENGYFAAGHHVTTWDGLDADNRRLAGGIYFLQLVSEEKTRHVKLVVLP